MSIFTALSNIHSIYIKNELLIPNNWCKIILSDPDVKGCTYKKVNDKWLLNVYHADKFSEPLDGCISNEIRISR